jgi:hypothetical protein
MMLLSDIKWLAKQECLLCVEVVTHLIKQLEALSVLFGSVVSLVPALCFIPCIPLCVCVPSCVARMAEQIFHGFRLAPCTVSLGACTPPERA